MESQEEPAWALQIPSKGIWEKQSFSLAKKIIELGQKRCSGHVLIFDKLSLAQLINQELFNADSSKSSS